MRFTSSLVFMMIGVTYGQVNPNPLIIPVTPNNGGIGTGINVPISNRFLGDGSDGPLNCASSTSGVKFLTTFTVANGATCTFNGSNNPVQIFATGACTIAGNLNARGVDGGISIVGDIGGLGGGGGGGAASGTIGSQSMVYQATNFLVAGTAGTAGNPGGDGAVIPSDKQRWAFLGSKGIYFGGAPGGAGGSSGGAAGKGGQAIIMSCASINFTGIIDVSGGPGISSIANSTGAGGGGGAGVVIMYARDSLINTGSIAVQGGPGGNCYAPAIVLSTPITGLPAGVTSGTGARAHISTFAGGNPTVVTVDAAGSGYSFTPTCTVSGGTGTGATCVVTMAGTGITQTVSSIAVSGGNAGYGTGTTYTTCGAGGYGGNGWSRVALMQ